MSQTPNISKNLQQAVQQPVITTQDVINKICQLTGRNNLSNAEVGIVELVMLSQHAMQIVAQEKQMTATILQKK